MKKIISLNNFEKVEESNNLIFPIVRNPIQEKISQIKETWGKIRKFKSLISSINLDEDKWQLGEGEDLSSHWFHSTLRECLTDYKKLKRIPSIQKQTLSDLNNFHQRLISIEQNLRKSGNKDL